MSDLFLITGASGFLGSRIALELKSRGIPAVTPRLDVRDPAAVLKAITGIKPTHVINCAAKGVDPTKPESLADLKAVNITGALNVQQACEQAGVKRFVHLGSCFEYGSHDSDIEETFELRPTTDYARTKAEASQWLLQQAAALKTSTIVLRPFGVWGPGEKAHRLVPQILSAARTGKPVPLTHGRQIRDFSFAGDMAGDIVALSQCHGLSNGVVNVGSGVGISVIDFARQVAKVLGAEDLLRPGELPSREGEMNRLVSSTRKLSTLIQLRPRTPLENGLKLCAVIA